MTTKKAVVNQTAEQIMLENLVRGDQHVWSEFYKDYRPVITRSVVKTLRRCGFAHTHADLEDIVAEVWVALLRYDRRKLRIFDADRTGLTTWMSILATNCTIDYLRGRWASKRIPVGVEPATSVLECPEPEDRLELHQRAMLTQRAVTQLNKREQTFLSLFLEDRIPADLARELGIAVSTVHTRKFRVCRKLSRLVGQNSPLRPAMAI